MRLERYYTVRLHCNFDLRAYPFDTQKCPIELEIPDHLQTQMTLVFHKVTQDELASLQYIFVNLNGQVKDNGNLLVLDIIMKR